MRIAPGTAAIMLLASPSNVDPLVSAADRVFEIALGSIVGLAVAILVFPARAHRTLVDKAAQTVTLLAEVLRNTLARFDGSRDDAAFTRLHERIRASLAEAETAGVEAERERSSHLTDDPDPATLLRAIRRLRHTVILVARASTEPLPDRPFPPARTSASHRQCDGRISRELVAVDAAPSAAAFAGGGERGARRLR